MTRGELFEEVAHLGLMPTVARVRHALVTGRIDRPAQDGAGNFNFRATHVRQFAAYLRNPPKRGKRPRAPREAATATT